MAVRHVSGDHLVAIVEIVSKGNKSGRKAFGDFVRKAAEFLSHQVHLLILDLQPPTARDPQGIHGAIWDEVAGQEYLRPTDKALTLASYESGRVCGPSSSQWAWEMRSLTCHFIFTRADTSRCRSRRHIGSPLSLCQGDGGQFLSRHSAGKFQAKYGRGWRGEKLILNWRSWLVCAPSSCLPGKSTTRANGSRLSQPRSGEIVKSGVRTPGFRTAQKPPSPERAARLWAEE